MTAGHRGRGAAEPLSVEELVAALPGSRVLRSPADTAPYASDWSRTAVVGTPLAVVVATSTGDVTTALRWANRHRIPTTVRGGGTGVSGGAVAYDGGLVISTERLDRILEISPVDRIAVVEPGVLVSDLDQAAAPHGLMYAPDPVSKDIATIGGTIATNAGGLRCLAHGVTTDAVAGLEVVLADGRLLRTGSRTRKSATGYDLTSLFVGSEGSLGVVTQAIVRLVPIPRGRRVTFAAAFPDARSAGHAVAAMMGRGLDLELLELLDHVTLELVTTHRGAEAPVDAGAMLLGMIIAVDADEQIAQAQTAATDAGALSFESSHGTGLLDVRASVKGALMAHGLAASCDAAVPPSRLAELLAAIDVIAARHGRVVATVAHAGDGNVHTAVQARDEPGDAEAVEAVLHEVVRAALAMDGVISGEHGIGSVKVDMVPEQLTEETHAVQRAVRELFDPHGILNPGRVI